MASDQKSQFIEGLKNYNISYEDIGKWRYCGGDGDESYFELFFRNKNKPNIVRQNECICGQKIIRNYFISDGNDILILGSTCIKRFLPNKSRTCDDCGAFHKNRKVNRCKYCRIGKCDVCNKVCNFKYKKCYTCAFQ